MRITDFTELTIPTSNDLLVVVDVVNDITKKLKLSSLPISTSVTTALATKQDTLVSGTNIKTLNSVSLLGSGNIVLTANPSGVAGAIQFSDGSAFSSDATNFFWDDTNNRLGIGTNAPSATGHFKGSGSTSATTSLLVQNSAGTAALTVRDDGVVQVLELIRPTDGTTNSFLKLSNATGTTMQYAGGFVTVSPNFRFGSTTLGSILEMSSATGKFLLGGGTQDASAKMQLNSTTEGFLPPRMTTTQRDAIATPATGLKIYNTTLGTTDTYDGATWQRFGQQTFIKGSGTTSATTSLLVQNSAGVDMMKITDDITTTIGNQFNIIRTTVPSQLVEINANFSTIAAGIRAGGNSKDFIISAKDSRDLYLSTNFSSSITQVQFAVKHNIGVLIKDDASTTMNASARLEVTSTTQGFLPPRMTTTQKNAIATPASGLVVYDTTTNKLCCYNGSSWNDLF